MSTETDGERLYLTEPVSDIGGLLTASIDADVTLTEPWEGNGSWFEFKDTGIEISPVGSLNVFRYTNRDRIYPDRFRCEDPPRALGAGESFVATRFLLAVSNNGKPFGNFLTAPKKLLGDTLFYDRVPVHAGKASLRLFQYPS